MKVYRVGGAVRDRLLQSFGGPAPADSDVDWVVVGATPAQMVEAGYRPVGRDFPVFLHPRTRDEYALARTERKSAPGYRGFTVHADPSVTLEEDLQRRDLTINAIAEDEQGRLIDPFGGARDLRDGVLRHVSHAFVEDPVRILRLARFAARWPGFVVAPETLALARRMVDAGEVDALVAERVWQELARGLMETRPSRMVEVLRDCGAFARLLPEVEALFGRAGDGCADLGALLLRVLDAGAALAQPLPVRWAGLVRHVADASVRDAWPGRALAQRLRVPVDCAALGELAAREGDALRRAAQSHAPSDAEATLQLLERCDALRRPERMQQLLAAVAIDTQARCGADGMPTVGERSVNQSTARESTVREFDAAVARHPLALALARVQRVDARAAAQAAQAAGLRGEAVGAAVRSARLAALG